MKRSEETKQAAQESFPNEGWEFQRVSFVQGAKWADKTMVDKACEWLKGNLVRFVYPNNMATISVSNSFFAEFRKAMEE